MTCLASYSFITSSAISVLTNSSYGTSPGSSPASSMISCRLATLLHQITGPSQRILALYNDPSKRLKYLNLHLRNKEQSPWQFHLRCAPPPIAVLYKRHV